MTNSNPSTPDPQDAEPSRSSDPLEEMERSGNVSENVSDTVSDTLNIVESGANTDLEEIENIFSTPEIPQSSEDRSMEILAELEALFPPDETEPDAAVSETLSDFGFDDLNLETLPVQGVTSSQHVPSTPEVILPQDDLSPETLTPTTQIEEITLAQDTLSAMVPPEIEGVQPPEIDIESGPDPEAFEAAVPVEPILAEPVFSADIPEAAEPPFREDIPEAPEPEAFEAAVPIEPIAAEPPFREDIPEAPEPEAFEAAVPIEPIAAEPPFREDIPEAPEPEAFEAAVPIEPIAAEPPFREDIPEAPEPEASEAAVPVEPISAIPPAPKPSSVPVARTSGVPAYREILNSREKVFGFLFILVSIGGILGWGWSQGMLDNIIKPSSEKPQSSIDRGDVGDGDIGDGDIGDGNIDSGNIGNGDTNSPENSTQTTGLKDSPSKNSSGSASNADGNAGSNVKSDKPPLKQLAPSAPPKLDVSDVPPDHWGYDYVVAMDKAGILPAFPDGQFQPDKPVTRAELAASLQQAFAIPSQDNPTTFGDVPPEFWAQDAIANAVDTGFMSGYSKDSFRPNENIPRYQVLVSLVSGLGLDKVSDADQVLASYPDANELPDWSKGQLAAAEKAKLIASPPQDKNTLSPNRLATRAEANAMIYKALVKYGKIKDGIPTTP